METDGLTAGLLIDSELKDLVSNEPILPSTGKPPLVSASIADWKSEKSLIQPCSVDLTIGLVQVPSAREDGRVKRVSRDRDTVVLQTGETAVVTTAEMLHVPDHIAGVGFPPSHVSIKGLLMTNPGHIDPGYDGQMHFTVINMGREPYTLQVGEPICTVLFFRLHQSVAVDLKTRRNPTKSSSQNATKSSPQNDQMGLPEADVNRLSRDFVNVERRSKKIADMAVGKAALYSGIIALVITVLSQGLPYWLGGVEEMKRDNAVMAQKVEELQRRVSALESEAVKPKPNKTSNIAAPTGVR